MTLVFTSGVFDLFHAGHIALLNQARLLGDKLIVGLDTDESARAAKGPRRPVCSFGERRAMLDYCNLVDEVLPFCGADGLRELLRKLTPGIVVKGKGYTADLPLESQLVKEWGGQFVAVDGPELSTSELIRRITDKVSLPSARRAFIVCGTESSGNRVLGSILCRAGCWGSGSTNQPRIEDIPTDAKNVMLILHHHLMRRYRDLTQQGFDVTAILTVREWNANLKSLVLRGHDANERAAADRIRHTLLSNLCDAVTYQIPLIVTTYESLNDDSIRMLLARLGLRTDNLAEPLELQGQEEAGQSFQAAPLQANAKHYAELQAT